MSFVKRILFLAIPGLLALFPILKESRLLLFGTSLVGEVIEYEYDRAYLVPDLGSYQVHWALIGYTHNGKEFFCYGPIEKTYDLHQKVELLVLDSNPEISKVSNVILWYSEYTLGYISFGIVVWFLLFKFWYSPKLRSPN